MGGEARQSQTAHIENTIHAMLDGRATSAVGQRWEFQDFLGTE